MKKAFYRIIVATVFFISCKKDQGKSTGPPPIANAGPDQQFASIPDSVILDGTASTNAGGSISAYKWREISSPNPPALIVNASSARTVVKKFSTGVYQFELSVKGNEGLYARDTVQLQITQEYILSSAWKHLADPSWDEISWWIDPSNSFPIGRMMNTPAEISVELDTASSWTVTSHWDSRGGNQTIAPNGYFWFLPNYPYDQNSEFIIQLLFPPDYQIADKPLKVKVKFY